MSPENNHTTIGLDPAMDPVVKPRGNSLLRNDTYQTRDDILAGFSFFKISWPVAVEHFLYLLITIVDAFILSQVSVNATAAVGACTFIVGFTLIAIVGFGQGASICISHCFGASKPFEAQSASRAAFVVISILGMCLGLLQFALHNHIPHWLGLTGEVSQNASIFLSIVGGTTVLQAIMIAIAFLLRAYGYPKQPMYAAILINIVNITLAYSLVHGIFGLPKLGVLGVSIATFLARLSGMFVMFYFAHKYLNFLFHTRHFLADITSYTKKIIKYGVPICLEPISYQGSQIIITRVIAVLGADALALRTYVWSIMNFNSVLIMGFSQATQILVGRLYGAKLYKDAAQEFERNLKVGLICTFGMVTVTWLLGKSLLSFFTHDVQMIEIGSTLFAIGYLMEPGRTSNIITGSALRSVGDPKFPLYTGLIFMWGLSIPVAWFFGIYLKLGLIGVWVGLACDEIVRAILNYQHFQKNRWQK